MVTYRGPLKTQGKDPRRLAQPPYEDYHQFHNRFGSVEFPIRHPGSSRKLTEEEFEVMKTHATLGYEMLKSSWPPILKAEAVIPKQHQEKWDGTGTPARIAGEDTHIYGRTAATADVFDALGASASTTALGPWETSGITSNNSAASTSIPG